MRRVLLTTMAAGFAAAMTAQTTAPAASAPAPAQASPSSSAVGTGGIAIIDAQRLALESAPGKEAYSRLQKMQAQKKDDLDKVEKEARDLVQKLTDQGGSMPADKLEQLQKQADDKQKAWKRMQEDAQKDLQEAERKEMQALENRIGPIVKDFFKERRYAVVLDSRAGIMYADDAVNVTDEVLKRINTNVALPNPAANNKASAATTTAPKPAAPAAPKPTPAAKKAS
ncbi:MAG TPA: OmpH family outer membrane protein [Thermoanaerobaculia bacterium]|nr:OmpH family outer membrane protein [Thermoanaerobaculia bacterium]